jgi:hypothetical protein
MNYFLWLFRRICGYKWGQKGGRASLSISGMMIFLLKTIFLGERSDATKDNVDEISYGVGHK